MVIGPPGSLRLGVVVSRRLRFVVHLSRSSFVPFPRGVSGREASVYAHRRCFGTSSGYFVSALCCPAGSIFALGGELSEKVLHRHIASSYLSL